MSENKHFLIIDGYPKESREEFDDSGMKYASLLYDDMLKTYLPHATSDIVYSSDPGVQLPSGSELEMYAGLLWPGCNLTIFNSEDERVTKMIKLTGLAYEAGIPQFGSCWGIQLAVVAAGGEVKPNPKGREMGIGRKILVTDAGKKHPMFKNKPHSFIHFVSHDDEVTRLPEGAELLAGNDFSNVQAVAVTFKKGVFWGVQYHPEYDLHEMARLIVAREAKLIELGFFKDHSDLEQYVNKMERLHTGTGRKDLRWQLGIDDDILSAEVRQCEFINWIDELII